MLLLSEQTQKEKKIGNIYGFTGGNYAGNVYDKNYICPALSTMGGGNQQPMIVAMRGRNPDNPKSREKSNYEQVLEPNTQGICNTLTSVQKDNLVLEEKPIVFDMYNKNRLNGDACGTITTGCATGGSGTFGVVSVGNVNPSNRGINGNVVSSDGLARAITIEKGEGQKICDTQNTDDYRIRKLTPRECWRLMGFSDVDFDKAATVNSNTQLYKEAGNSIVKNVLMAIFRQLNIQGVEKFNKY